MKITIKNNEKQLSKENIKDDLLTALKEISKFNFDFEKNADKELIINISNDVNKYGVFLEVFDDKIELTCNVNPETKTKDFRNIYNSKNWDWIDEIGEWVDQKTKFTDDIDSKRFTMGCTIKK